MTSPAPPTPAQTLLKLLHPAPGAPEVTDAMANKAVNDFLTEIVALDRRHNRKPITQDQLAEMIFGHSLVFSDDRSKIAYCRYNLHAAVEHFSGLCDDIKSNNNGIIPVAEMNRFSRIIRDYMFDLREIVTFLQRNVNDYVFFHGGKNADVNSWEVYILAKGLAYQSAYTGQGGPFDHKAAQIASIFVLRQAMELRFQRLIAVYPTDKKCNSPKLRHGFHQDFIVAHPQFFKADGFRIKELRHLYDWCSGIVHQVYQPYAWQIALALRRGGELLHTRQVAANEPWSINNAVEIIDVEEMQKTYENHFLATYGHGQWRMTREKPEALIRNWKPEMAFTGSEYRLVAAQTSKRADKGFLRTILYRVRSYFRM